MQFMRFSLAGVSLLLPLSLAGCMFIVDTGVRELDSDLKGACLKTVTSSYLYVSDCPAVTGKYLVSTRSDGRPQCLPDKPYRSLEAGTELEIQRVMRQGRGATGSCLRIEVIVREKETPGWRADLPVCGLAHPRPFWITKGFDQTSEIIFDEEFVTLVPCNESMEAAHRAAQQ